MPNEILFHMFNTFENRVFEYIESVSSRNNINKFEGKDQHDYKNVYVDHKCKIYWHLRTGNKKHE